MVEYQRETVVLQGGSLPNSKEKGGGADGYIPDFKPVIFRR